MPDPTNNTISLNLAGGGARGIIQVGMLRSLARIKATL